MSKYSELIMCFDKIRDYMRDFYVYGFMSREDFGDKKILRTMIMKREELKVIFLNICHFELMRMVSQYLSQ